MLTILRKLRLGVGAKTLVALSVTFWLPFMVLAGLLFYFFQAPVQEEVTAGIKGNLKAATATYQERAAILNQLLQQLARRPEVVAAFSNRDSARLQHQLLDFGAQYRYVSLLIGCDDRRKVIGRRNGHVGDIADISESLTQSLLVGTPSLSTELISKEMLVRENEENATLFWDRGLVHLVVAPVKSESEGVVGALVAGILLSDDPTIGNAVYNKLGVEMALFAGNPSENALLHATTSLPRNIWVVGQSLPNDVRKELSLGKPFYGFLDINQQRVIAAFEPVMDSRNRIVGAFGISDVSRDADSIILGNIGRSLIAAALIGLLLSLLVVWFVHNDINQPLRELEAAMRRFGDGDVQARVDLQTGDEFEHLGSAFNEMADHVIKREERMRKHNEVARLLMSTLQLDELLDQTLRIVVAISESQVGVIYIWDSEIEKLVPRSYYGATTALRALSFGEGFPGRAAKDRTPLYVSAPEEGDGAHLMELGIYKSSPKQLAYIPLVFQNSALGVILIGGDHVYREDERLLFDYVADQIAIALQNAIMHKQIHEMSICDGLTGLFNRRHLLERFNTLWNQPTRGPISVLLGDIDNFKAINDNYGHDRGDEVIIAVANAMRTVQRKGDLLCRYGGEEFVCILPETSIDAAIEFAEQLLESVRGREFAWKNAPATMSVGVACTAGNRFTRPEDMFQAADKAMYQGKTSGKNKVVLYGE